MKRRAFLKEAIALPALLCAAAGTRRLAAAGDEETTRDLFAGDFPPAVYGQTLEEVETTIQQVIERVFRDEDGMLRSGVNGRTMKPLTVNDVKDRPNGKGGHSERMAIPDAFKAVFMNYENAGKASGTYLEALCIKAKETGDPKARELARRTVDAIVLLWKNAAPPTLLGGGGRGWFPKPYGGIRNVAGMEECSADQYVDVTLGLHAYHLMLANDAEKKQIEEVIVSFSDWWHDHDYSGIYFGKAIWWKRLDWHPMAAACFLYLHALAHSWNPGPKSQKGFETWIHLKATLMSQKQYGPSMHGIPVICLEHLIQLRPELTASVWRPSLIHQARLLAQSLEGSQETALCSQKGSGANYLAVAHRMLPDAGYDALSLRCLEACKRREDFYHLRRGLRLAKVPAVMRGDDYRHTFDCNDQAHWMAAYWKRRLVSSSAKQPRA
jgi:hypothetical protein